MLYMLSCPFLNKVLSMVATLWDTTGQFVTISTELNSILLDIHLNNYRCHQLFLLFAFDDFSPNTAFAIVNYLCVYLPVAQNSTLWVPSL